MENDIEPIMVTGASGYLGSSVVKNLNARKLKYIPISRYIDSQNKYDITNLKTVKALLRKVKPAVVIHCASLVPSGYESYNEQYFWKKNFAMLSSLASLSECRIIYPSSMAVYNEANGVDVSEDSNLAPQTVYGQSKLREEQRLLDRGYSGDQILRLPGLFGYPRASGVIYNITKNMLTGGGITLNKHYHIWAAMAVVDAAEYMVRSAISQPFDSENIINVGYSGDFSLAHLVLQISKYLQIPPENFDDHYPTFSMNLDRLARRLGLIQTTFTQRLYEFIEEVKREVVRKESNGNVK